MTNLNSTLKATTKLKKQATKGIEELIGLYTTAQKELEQRLHDELRQQEGSYEGLEDFYTLVSTLKQNTKIIRGTLGIIKKLADVSDYTITDIQE